MIMEEELMKLGLDEEAARMAAEYIEENFGDIEELKNENARLQEQLDDGSSGQYSRLMQEYDALKSKYDDEVGTLSQQLSDNEHKYSLEKALTQSGCRNQTAAQALLNMDAITGKDGKNSGLEEEIARIKEEAPYLFEEQKKKSAYRPVNGKVKKSNDLKKQIYAGLRGE